MTWTAAPACGCSARKLGALARTSASPSIASVAFSTSAPTSRPAPASNDASATASSISSARKSLARWKPDPDHPMLPIQPRRTNWLWELGVPMHTTPEKTDIPRVPIGMLAGSTPGSDAAPPDSSASTSSSDTPGPLILRAKHAQKHAVRSIELHLNSGAKGIRHSNSFEAARRAADMRSPTIGFQPHKDGLTEYKGFTRAAEIREAHAGPDDGKGKAGKEGKEADADADTERAGGKAPAVRVAAEMEIAAHIHNEVANGDYSDHVASGPLLARLLRGTSPESKDAQDDDVVAQAHDAVRVADQALAHNASLNSVAKQYILDAVKRRVDQ